MAPLFAPTFPQRLLMGGFQLSHEPNPIYWHGEGAVDANIEIGNGHGETIRQNAPLARDGLRWIGDALRFRKLSSAESNESGASRSICGSVPP